MKTILIIAMVMLAAVSQAQNWEVKHYVDAFGDQGDRYIEQTIKGNVSSNNNKHSDGMDWYLKVHVGNKNAGFFASIFENWQAEVLPYGSTVYMKNSKEEKEQFDLYDRWNKDGGNIVNRPKLVRFLSKSSGIVRIIIASEDGMTYKFSVNANGFNKAYNSI